MKKFILLALLTAVGCGTAKHNEILAPGGAGGAWTFALTATGASTCDSQGVAYLEVWGISDVMDSSGNPTNNYVLIDEFDPGTVSGTIKVDGFDVNMAISGQFPQDDNAADNIVYSFTVHTVLQVGTAGTAGNAITGMFGEVELNMNIPQPTVGSDFVCASDFYAAATPFELTDLSEQMELAKNKAVPVLKIPSFQ